MTTRNGLSDLSKTLSDLAKRAQELHGEHSVPVNELLTPDFVSAHTRFANVEALFAASPFKIETSEDLEAVPDAEMDAYIRSISSFPDWSSMLGAAGELWASKRLGL